MKICSRFRAPLALTGVASLVAGILPTVAFAAPPAFQTAVLANNPYAYYRVGESSGTTAADSSGNNRTGSYVGSPTLGVMGAGGGDTAVGLNGSSQYVTTDQASGFGSLMGNASWEFVFSTTNTSAQMAMGGSANTGSVTNWEATLNRNAAGSTSSTGIRMFLRDDNNASIAAAFTAAGAFDGGYHDVLFTYDKTGATADTRLVAYLDGVQQTLTFNATATPTAFSAAAFNESFGARQNRGTADLFLSGNLDEAAIYSSTLSASAAAAHAAALIPAAIPEPASLSLLGLGAMALLARRRRSA